MTPLSSEWPETHRMVGRHGAGRQHKRLQSRGTAARGAFSIGADREFDTVKTVSLSAPAPDALSVGPPPLDCAGPVRADDESRRHGVHRPHDKCAPVLEHQRSPGDNLGDAPSQVRKASRIRWVPYGIEGLS